ARTDRCSEVRSTVSTLVSIVMERPAGIAWDSLPFGPSTLTVWSSRATFTPAGTGMGFLPIRDMGHSLPDVRQHFAADLLLAAFAVSDDATRRRQDGDAHATQDGRNLVLGHIDPASRPRHAHQAGDHLLVTGAVLEVDPQDALLVILDEPVVLDEALLLEEFRDPHLELRGRNIDL